MGTSKLDKKGVQGGARGKNNKKLKSVKSKSGLKKMGSKRKLSRFGKERKAGEQGIQTAFISRTQILKRLQITLKDFRRLSILKGIYPRDPRRTLKAGKNKTYYHYKDVAHLSHEPLLDHFRVFKAFMKKVRKCLGRRDFEGAKRLHAEAPGYTLGHLVKERYPKFSDALGDLDDALNLVHMFAALPAKAHVTSERTRACRELVTQWQFFLAQASTSEVSGGQGELTKCFISVKGIYFQATVQGVPITWINPHEYTQRMPNSVDYRTMLTFLEFYETLLKFTLFKLYHAHGLRYPPPPASESDYLTHGRLLAIKAQALDDANDETSAAEGGGAAEDDEEEEDEEAIAGKISALPGKGAPGNAASAAAKAAAKRVKAVRKRLAKAVAMKGGSGQGNGADEEDDEGDEDEEGGDDDDDDEEAGGLGGASGLSRAEVNEQLEAALVAATSSSSGSLVKTDNSRSGDGESAGDAPLFAGLVFWLSRESQYAWLEFAIRCGGGGVGWAGSAIGENDPSVTHVVYDRPTAPQLTRSDVEYVQPQWIADSLNLRYKLPVERYRPGAVLPPHLSPFVDDAKEGYVPAYRTELDALKSAAEEYGNVNAAGGGQLQLSNAESSAGEGDAENSNEDENSDEEEEGEEENDDDEEEGESGEDEDDDEMGSRDDEGTPAAKPISEEKQLALTMMSKKAKRLYDRMQHGLNKKSGAVDTLKKKRKAAEAKAPSPAPETRKVAGGQKSKRSVR